MKDEIGDLIKRYEHCGTRNLLSGIPVIIRIDGRSFSSFCKRFKYPYDEDFNHSMNEVCIKLCEELQDCKFAQRHSDEMSFLIHRSPSVEKKTDGYFGLNIDKICSITASYATSVFVKLMITKKYLDVCDDTFPTFDSRCFNLPEEIVPSYFHWRYLDASRNSVNSWVRNFFSRNQLSGKTSAEMKDLMLKQKNFDWTALPNEQKNGFYFSRFEVGMNKIIMNKKTKKEEKIEFVRNQWLANPIPKSFSLQDKISELMM